MNLAKKVLFTCITTILFLVFLECFFFFLPKIIGLRQQKAYDHIVNGSTEIIVVGDSVSFGYGLEASQSWPSVLFSQFQEQDIQISVRNRSVSGNDSLDMERDKHSIDQVVHLHKRPVVLVMIGHNDFIGHGWRSWSSQDNGEAVAPQNINPPRLFRVMRWMNKMWESKGEVNWQDPFIEKRVRSNIQNLSEYTEENGGRMYLMTYLVPGVPTKKLSPSNQDSLQKAREYQIQANEILRKIASESNIALIDIEETVAVPETWDSSWWIDHIHPRAIGHLQIATATKKHLAAYGEIPISSSQ